MKNMTHTVLMYAWTFTEWHVGSVKSLALQQEEAGKVGRVRSRCSLLLQIITWPYHTFASRQTRFNVHEFRIKRLIELRYFVHSSLRSGGERSGCIGIATLLQPNYPHTISQPFDEICQILEINLFASNIYLPSNATLPKLHFFAKKILQISQDMSG